MGGVTPENLAQWIKAGCTGAGLGSDLYRAGQSVERTNGRRQHLLKRIERQCNENNQTHHVSFTPALDVFKIETDEGVVGWGEPVIEGRAHRRGGGA